jgi:hypothetical protein
MEGKEASLQKDKEIKTINLSNGTIAKIKSIKAEKTKLQAEVDVIQALFDKENKRESDLLETILEYNDVKVESIEKVVLSEDGKQILVTLK